MLDNSVNLYARQILGWESLPPPNIIGLIRNFCRRMDLPPAARVVAERLSELMPVRTAVSTSEMYLNQQSLTSECAVRSLFCISFGSNPGDFLAVQGPRWFTARPTWMPWRG